MQVHRDIQWYNVQSIYKRGRGVVIEGGDWVVKLLSRVQLPVLLRPSRGFLEDPMRHIAYVASKIEGRGFKILPIVLGENQFTPKLQNQNPQTLNQT